jgi:hypothetical protein
MGEARELRTAPVRPDRCWAPPRIHPVRGSRVGLFPTAGSTTWIGIPSGRRDFAHGCEAVEAGPFSRPAPRPDPTRGRSGRPERTVGTTGSVGRGKDLVPPMNHDFRGGQIGRSQQTASAFWLGIPIYTDSIRVPAGAPTRPRSSGGGQGSIPSSSRGAPLALCARVPRRAPQRARDSQAASESRPGPVRRLGAYVS